jgi:hypothetical protein
MMKGESPRIKKYLLFIRSKNNASNFKPKYLLCKSNIPIGNKKGIPFGIPFFV